MLLISSLCVLHITCLWLKKLHNCSFIIYYSACKGQATPVHVRTPVSVNGNKLLTCMRKATSVLVHISVSVNP